MRKQHTFCYSNKSLRPRTCNDTLDIYENQKESEHIGWRLIILKYFQRVCNVRLDKLGSLQMEPLTRITVP